ncbi:Mpo1-like protein [Niveibacterium sp. SC-1]|uniref:Mpo1 family 2-hydroxy fatty acid dioxygenase n=1 Tax=Niveibacterium sp. SC-1 TaxID=3135646 RepID=UPI0031203B18
MRNAQQLLVQYARYHRDRRNIATHFVGVPLIVFAVAVLLSRPQLALAGTIAGFGLTPAWIAAAFATLWWMTRGEWLPGLLVSAFTLGCVALGSEIARASTASWLAAGLGSFALGWLIQFVGHYWEGRKPAFVDDLIGLLVGPLFVAAELLFAAGWNPTLYATIQREAGPLRTGLPTSSA